MKGSIIQKALSIIAVFALIAAMLPFSALAKTEVRSGEIWDGSIAEGFADGSGTEEDPYLISNGAELALLSENVDMGMSYQGSFFELTNDIYLNDPEGYEEWNPDNAPANLWKPIGGRTITGFPPTIMYFGGSFDGCGHTVYGVYYYSNQGTMPPQNAGLFGAAAECVIMNLSVVQSKFIADNVYLPIAPIVGNLGGIYSVRGGTVINCFTDCMVLASRNVGGIAGEAVDAQIINCVSLSHLEGNSVIGGIAGSGSGEIIGCINEGSIFVSDDEEYSQAVGGIIGEAEMCSVEDCENHGTLLCPASVSVGGIVGSAPFGDETSYTNIIRCHNSGDICGDSAVGGIIGFDGDAIVSVENSYNSGRIVGSDAAGGICDVSYWNGEGSGFINCYNAGSVEGDGEHNPIIGEVFSNTSPDPDTENCYYLDTCCENADEYGTALTDEQMRNAESYAGFDFDAVWTMDGDPDYPYAELIGRYSGIEIIPGDVDGSGVVAVADAIMTLRVSMGIIELTPEQFAAADINGDGDIAVADAIIILRKAMGLI